MATSIGGDRRCEGPIGAGWARDGRSGGLWGPLGGRAGAAGQACVGRLRRSLRATWGYVRRCGVGGSGSVPAANGAASTMAAISARVWCCRW